MVGKILKSNWNDIDSILRFSKRVGKYELITTIYLWNEKFDDLWFSGRFDFNFNGSANVTNKGIKAINAYKQYVFDCIDKAFGLGCQYIEIGAAPFKLEKRFKLYKRILSEKYDIEDTNSNDLFLIFKKDN